VNPRTQHSPSPGALLEKLDGALALVSWHQRLDAAEDAGLLCAVLARLCVLTVDELIAMELLSTFNPVSRKADAMRQGADTVELNQQLAELRVLVADRRENVEKLISLFVRSSGQPVSRDQLAAEFRTETMNRRIRELESRPASEAVAEARPATDLTAAELVVSPTTGYSGPPDSAVGLGGHLHHPDELVALEEDEIRERRNTTWFLGGVIAIPVLGAASAVFIVMSAGMASIHQSLFPVAILTSSFVLSAKCEKLSRLARDRAERARRRRFRMPESLIASLPDGKKVKILVKEAEAWYADSMSAGPEADKTTHLFLRILRRDGRA
jgi:hypothetical protein